MKTKPDFSTALGEVGVLGQEAVAGVDGLRVGHFRRADDGGHMQVTLAGRRRADAHGLVRQLHILGFGVGFGMHGDGLDAHFAAGALDAQRDLAAIGNENLFKHDGRLRRSGCAGLAFEYGHVDLTDDEQRLAELDCLAVLHEDGLDHASLVRLDLVQQLHRLDDAQGVAFVHALADIHE